ncbi:hypothetical protein GGR56DRAFT_148501 [Xylariaceae sp. FL0804]|nr:hypothetical protein GGR56DRAFT_148501 [Xylariaceae sp. FL0804]
MSQYICLLAVGRSSVTDSTVMRWLMTQIRSARLMVLNRRATATVTRPLVAQSRASCAILSDYESNDNVTSSSSSIFGFRSSARIIAIRCFYPPPSMLPKKPTRAERPSLQGEVSVCLLGLVYAWSKHKDRGSRDTGKSQSRQRHDIVVYNMLPSTGRARRCCNLAVRMRHAVEQIREVVAENISTNNTTAVLSLGFGFCSVTEVTAGLQRLAHVRREREDVPAHLDARDKRRVGYEELRHAVLAADE